MLSSLSREWNGVVLIMVTPTLSVTDSRVSSPADAEGMQHPREDLGLVAEPANRPDGPVCAPAPVSHRNRQRGDHSGSESRRAATHFAGSWTITRGSCKAPVTSRSGRDPAGGRLSYGE